MLRYGSCLLQFARSSPEQSRRSRGSFILDWMTNVRICSSNSLSLKRRSFFFSCFFIRLEKIVDKFELSCEIVRSVGEFETEAKCTYTSECNCFSLCNWLCNCVTLQVAVFSKNVNDSIHVRHRDMTVTCQTVMYLLPVLVAILS